MTAATAENEIKDIQTKDKLVPLEVIKAVKDIIPTISYSKNQPTNPKQGDMWFQFITITDDTK